MKQLRWVSLELVLYKFAVTMTMMLLYCSWSCVRCPSPVERAATMFGSEVGQSQQPDDRFHGVLQTSSWNRAGVLEEPWPTHKTVQTPSETGETKVQSNFLFIVGRQSVCFLIPNLYRKKEQSLKLTCDWSISIDMKDPRNFVSRSLYGAQLWSYTTT